jgi:xylulokinase
MTYLGIDIGTSGVKALLIDEHGRALGEASAASVEPVRPHPGWSEQNPADWWTATLAAVDKLKASHATELASVRGIGLSGHMHGATLLGKDDEVLRPCILWNDGRSAAECTEMEAALPSLRDIAGNIAMPGFTAPKIAWVRNLEPEVF